MADRKEMHPAAAVFLAVIAGEISEENKCLRKDIMRLKPILDRILTIEVLGPDITEGIKYEPVATAKLEEGMLTRFDEENEDSEYSESFMPVMDSQGILLKPGRGLAVQIAGHVTEIPHSFDRSFVCFGGDEDAAAITFRITPTVFIQGTLTGIDVESIAVLREEHGKIIYFKLADIVGELNSDNVMFMPAGITLYLNRLPYYVKHILNLAESTFAKMNVSIPEKKTPAEELRALTVAALGCDAHKTLLTDNIRLKQHRSALMALRESITSIDIFHRAEYPEHRDQTMRFSLENGKIANENDGDKAYWSIKVKEEEKCSMLVPYIHQSEFFISGETFQGSNSVWVEFLPSSNPEIYPEAGVRIKYARDIEVIGMFNWSDLTIEELAHTRENFRLRVNAAVFGMPQDEDFDALEGDITQVLDFPLSFGLNVVEVNLSGWHLQYSMNMLSLVGNIRDA